MNGGLPSLCVASLALALAGCHIEILGSGRHRHEPSSTGSGVEAEIHASRSLSFDSDQRAALLRIARRSDLSADEQVYLLDTAYDLLSFSASRLSVTLALIESPAFSREAKIYILENIDELSFESEKSAVLRAIDERVGEDSPPRTTGTPAGVGNARKVSLKPRDRLLATIDRIGTLENGMVAVKDWKR